MIDATTSTLISAGAALFGAFIGGFLSYKGATYAVDRAFRDLELAEIRRLKVECIVALMGLRWVISTSPDRTADDKAQLKIQLNRIAALWADDPQVLRDLRDFKAQLNNARFIALVRSLGKSTKLPIELLSDSDLEMILGVN